METGRTIRRKETGACSREVPVRLKHISSLSLAFALLLSALLGIASAQSSGRRQSTPQKKPANPLADLKAEVVSTAQAYKTSLEKVRELQEPVAKAAASEVTRLKGLLDQGIISRRELEEAVKRQQEEEGRLAETMRQITDTDHLIVEATAEEQLARLGPAKTNGYVSTHALIRYGGSRAWLIAEVSRIDAFFVSQFHRSLPVSALGQSSVHDRLGFDHRNSVDVALQPDSIEGQILMSYLRQAGIPFLAFRSAVPGAATGPHIHIGYPSKRLIR